MTRTGLRRHAGSAAFLAVMLLASSAPWSEYWCAHHNTLHETARWRTSKTECRKGLIGGATSRLTRVMLHRNRLDLSAWFGYQEVYLAEPLAVTSARFSFRLVDDAHVSVLFDGGGPHFQQLHGFRLSRRAESPSMALATGEKRLFTSTRAFDVPLGDGWHEAEVQVADRELSLAVDGVERARLAVPAAARRRIGFRGGAAEALVDDVVVHHRAGGGPAVIVEAFDRADLRPTAHGVGVVLAAALLLAVCAGARACRRRPRLALLLACAVTTSAGLLGWALFTLDHWWLSSRYPKNVLAIPEYENTMFRPEVPDRSWRERHPDAARDPYTIVFVGGSQTWGSGANVGADVWTRLVERTLDGGVLGPVECVNVAISGATSTSLLDRYREEWRDAFAPDLTVVNLGHNDRVLTSFGANLVKICEAAREVGSKVAFVLEPNSPENVSAHLEHSHAVMRLAAEHCDVPLLDLHGRFAGLHERGFLWWDRVHMTSAGQELLAAEVSRWLAETMR